MVSLHCMIVDIAAVLQIQKKVGGKITGICATTTFCASADFLIAGFTCLHLALSGRITRCFITLNSQFPLSN